VSPGLSGARPGSAPPRHRRALFHSAVALTVVSSFTKVAPHSRPEASRSPPVEGERSPRFVCSRKLRSVELLHAFVAVPLALMMRCKLRFRRDGGRTVKKMPGAAAGQKQLHDNEHLTTRAHAFNLRAPKERSAPFCAVDGPRWGQKPVSALASTRFPPRPQNSTSAR
jgi:hypothetical protein